MPLKATEAEEVVVAGRIIGGLFLMGGASTVLSRILPAVTHVTTWWLIVNCVIACGWGVAALWLIDWRRHGRWLIHASTVGACALVAAGTGATTGVRSPVWIYLFFVIVFAAYFFAPKVAVRYVGLAVLTMAVPLFYDPRAHRAPYLAQVIIAASAFAILTVAVGSGKTLNAGLRRRALELAGEQGVLRRVATAVVDGRSAAEVYNLVSEETGRLLGAVGAGVLRLSGSRTLVVAGAWSALPEGRYEPGRSIPILPGSNLEQAILTGRPVLVSEHAPDTAAGRLGYASSIVVPINVGGRTWGLLTVASHQPGGLGPDDEEHLTEVVQLLGASIASMEDRATLAARASSDPLTGLSNHREFHERLNAEVVRARANEVPLAIAVLDIDHFKELNDAAGHATGDRLLALVARCLREHIDPADTLGRIGGDEFAWIMPGRTREQALSLVDQARKRVTAAAPPPFRVTMSAGICDTDYAFEASRLIQFADGALYWSKAHGRDQTWVYDPEVIDELSAQERADRLARSQALSGLRALARATDAKDPATREHSERVSRLVGKLAMVSGWDAEAAVRLSEAALVHDVGKIGVPDQTLRKTEPLTDEEWEQIRGHAELSARIVEGVLAAEQVEWVRTHHERPDGRGYPRGLHEDEIPEGALLMAVADAFDVMTVSRPYSVPKSVEAAVTECQALVGRQFSADAVAALLELYREGQLEMPAHPDLTLSRA